MLDPRTRAQIRANAEMTMEALSQARGSRLSYDAASIAWLEEFIEGQRVRTDVDKDKLAAVLGSFLGEAILAATDGDWAEHDGKAGVQFANGAWCFPFAKVAKQFEGGREAGESIRSFYDIAVAEIATENLKRRARR